MRIGQLPAGHLGGSTLGVCGRRTCPVTYLRLSEMLSVSVGSRKPLDFPLPVLSFMPATFRSRPAADLPGRYGGAVRREPDPCPCWLPLRHPLSDRHAP